MREEPPLMCEEPLEMLEADLMFAGPEHYASEFGKVYDNSLPINNDVKQNSSVIKTYNFNKMPVTYTWSNLNVYYTLKNNNVWNQFFNKRNEICYQKHILKNVSGIAYPGELLVIMGSSGAGKTTLLDALTYQHKTEVVMSGNITINGKRVNSSMLTSQMAYVQQHDLFIGTLTVKEHLIFQALVRMDKKIPYYQRIQRVNEIISELALINCQNTVIGIPGRLKGISGGEMKRLSFASEVLTDPPLMLCDEPTSGLDSCVAHQVITVLKNLADKGKTIITTMHQPSTELFNMFNKILLIAEGRVAFMGTSEEAYTFFKSIGALCPNNYNPADFFIQLLAIIPGKENICKYTVNTVCDKYENSDTGIQISFKIKRINAFENDTHQKNICVLNKKLRYKVNWFQQFRAVLWRSWISVIKEPILIKVRLLQTIMVSILIGIIYLNQKLDQDGVMNINGALFIFLTNMTFQNVFAVINVFCSELPIFLREHRNGIYRVDVYFLCKTIAEAPIFIAVPIIFTIITYPMIGLYPNIQHFLATTGIMILVANVSTSFGYFISCISKDISMALSIGPPIIIPFLLFGGFFLNTASVPLYFKWFSYLSWFRYGNEALLINQWSDVDMIACTKINVTCPKSGLMVLQTLNFKKDYFWLDICALLLLIIIFRIIAFLALLSKTLRKRKII
ncbi:PREDICTED: protein white-like [Ceratosolen solmsi marchali]|uniref:Protein white n=1 Tax=Ceratosolen solmsi marchali TaxID=326594 RepID=A0AAJ7E143_9HYME|nr:PREDICTED: protein white-like [Ceratosolen solmsi marchali]